MSNVATTATATVSLLVTAAAALAAPAPGFTLAAQTPRFSFYTKGAKVDADKSEQYLTKVEQVLGAQFDGHAEYYRYESPKEVAMATGNFAEGVTLPGQKQIHSAHGFHAHEIVHLLATQLGNPGAMFHEGLAVVLGNDAKWGGKDVDGIAKRALKGRDAVRTLAQFETIPTEFGFPLAASFVRDLSKRHGMAKLADFFRACPQPGQRDAAFQQTFGVSYAQAVATWAEAL
jgi:hypothetical protein